MKTAISRDSTPPCFGTPTANALLTTKAAKASFVVLIRDRDNDCGAADRFSGTVKSMSDAGTKVFVVGINGSTAADRSALGIKALNKAACASGVPADPSQCAGKTYSGTGPAFYLSTNAAKLSADLAAIATKLTCK